MTTANQKAIRQKAIRGTLSGVRRQIVITRVIPDDADRIRRAAEAQNISQSDFVAACVYAATGWTTPAYLPKVDIT